MVKRQHPLDRDELVFKALADATRRSLLDRLRLTSGQSLSELCDGVGMARQSVTQHVDVLVAAGLVVVVRRGRLRLHYLNPEPIHRIQSRWIATFDQPRLDVLHDIRNRAEETTIAPETVPTYVYVTYINAPAERVWDALTQADLTAQYWRHHNVSDWQVGSAWEHQRLASPSEVDVMGRVLLCEPPTRLQITFEAPGQFPSESPSVVTFSIEDGDGITRLQVMHENLADANAHREISHGWPAVLANLKSFLETGSPLPRDPWQMTPTAH